MVKPMVNEKEYEEVADALNDLQNNEGPKLQKILQDRSVCCFHVPQGISSS